MQAGQERGRLRRELLLDLAEHLPGDRHLEIGPEQGGLLEGQQSKLTRFNRKKGGFHVRGRTARHGEPGSRFDWARARQRGALQPNL